MPYRVLLLLLSLTLWIAAGFYAVYVNKLRLEQFKLLYRLRELRRENNELYWKISRVENFQRARKFAREAGFVPVKPYRVADFAPYLEGKPLVDFYTVWFGDTLWALSRKLGLSLGEIYKYNPHVYLRVGQRIAYPVSFPWALPGKKSKGNNGKSQGHHR